MSYPYNPQGQQGQPGQQYYNQGQGQGQYQDEYTNGHTAPYPPPGSAPPPSWEGSNGYGSYPSGGPVQQHHQNTAYPAHSQPLPRSASYGAFGQQQSYPPAPSYRPSSYNPQEYAHPHSPPAPQYDPRSYGQSVHRTSSASQQTYNPADYAATGVQSPTTAQYPYGQVPYPTSNYPSSQPEPLAYPSASPQSQYQYQYQPPYQPPSSASPQLSGSYTQTRLRSQSRPNPPPPPPEHSYVSNDHQYSRPGMAPSMSSYDDGVPTAMPGLTPDELNLPTPPVHSDLNIYYSQDPPPSDHQSASPLHASVRMPSPPPPPPPAHGSPQRSNTLRHPQLRPLPGPPPGEIQPDFGADYFLQRPHDLRNDYANEEEAQDDLFNQVESAVLSAGRASSARRHSPRVDFNDYDPAGRPQPLFSPRGSRNGRNGSSSSNHLLAPNRASVNDIIDEYSDNDVDDDAEALAGLEAMRMAEEQEAAEEARRGGSSGFVSAQGSIRSRRQPEPEEDSFAGVDMSTLGGGYDAHLSYDANPITNGTSASPQSHPISTHSSQRSVPESHASSNPSIQGSIYDPRTAMPTGPRVVDIGGGTGGLAVPARRQSYNEGDEDTLMDDYAQSWEPPDLFFHPEPSSTHRPLPPPPTASDDSVPLLATNFHSQPATPMQPPYPASPAGYERSTTDPDIWVPRSASLISREPAPIVQPIRSKTDAEDRRSKQGYRGSVYSGFDTTPATSAVAVDLPSLPTRRFNPAKLGNADFKKCDEPWALSSILRWLLTVADPDRIAELREAMVKDALVALFTNKVPTMNIADAETLSNRVVDDMYTAGTLSRTEEWVKLIPGAMSGVIFQLTMAGCYAPTIHNHIIPGRCYAHHCQRTLKKVNLQTIARGATEDWATFHGMKKEDVEGKDKKVIELQNNLHEIVQTEEIYMENLDVLIRLYRDPLSMADSSVINPKRVGKFIADVFGKVDAVRRANEEHLLPQLKYRQKEEGPWVKGFSDIFRQWIRKAKAAYIEYAAGFPGASLLMRQEIERNLDFRNFVDRARSQKMSNKLGWDNYIKAPITRLQRYSLLLQTVHKNMRQASEEKNNLQIAIEEIKAVTLECDHRVAEMQAKVDLMDLNQKLVLRQGMQQEVELNLNYLGRELIFRGDLQRAGQTRLSWVDTHAILFDHYLVLAKVISVVQKGTGGKIERYDVSRLPIPMDLLVLESPSEDAVVKSSYVRGITSVTPVSKASSSPDPGRIGRSMSGLPRSESLQHMNTSSSMTHLSTVNSNSSAKIAPPTILEGPKDSEKIMYPFRVHHLGKEVYTLFAPTAANRTDWCNKIIEAKTKHAIALHAQNAEPLRLRVMADSAFYYDTYTGSSTTQGKPVVIKGTPTDRAIKEVEHRFKDTGRPAPICRARVNCATSFTTPYPGKHMVAVGTDYGVYVSEMDNPRGWFRAITQTKVTQIAVLEEFSLCVLLADKSLIAYHLDAICPSDRSMNGANADSARKAPQKLSGSRDVGFFAVGRMKERTLVFYKKREGVSSIFKVLEPVFLKTTEKKRGIFKRGTTDFFRDYDDFYVATECTGINLFQNSLAVSTDRGFEVLTLDKKQPWGVPDWKAPEVANIATHVEKQTTLGMLRLNDQEFLLCYEKCAVYVNKHGEVCRSVVMNFVAKAKSAALYGPYLILFDTDFVEIRNAQNGRLKQIIAGRDIKCLDDGGGGTISGGSTNTAVVNGVTTGLGAASRTVKVVMQHPELERTQIVVELVLNDSLKE